MTKKKKLIPLTESPEYVKFTDARNKALEAILWVHLKAMDQIVGKLHDKVLVYIKHPFAVNAFAKHGQGQIANEFDYASVQVYILMVRLRKEAYFLAHASEAEAIGRALSKQAKRNIKLRDHIQAPMHDGAHLADRVQLWFDRMSRKLQDALSLSLVMRSDEAETLKRVERVFSSPGVRPQRLKVKALTKHREADPGEDPGSTIKSMSFGFADEEQWGNIVDDYFDENLPSDIFKRGPTDKMLFYDVTSQTTEERYSWEIEQEVTEDFVRSVRSGEQDAANENGITDFEWDAILDQVTDECCRKRDGMLSSEIEKALADGKLDEDECDAIVAPGHFRCRCRSTPATADLPEAPDVDYAGFDEWLTNKGKAV